MAWLTGWSKRKALTLATPSELLSDFPFPVRITADTDIGVSALATGYDIRFTASDGTTLLDYERDTFAVTAGAATGLWWVEIPSWSALAETTIYAYYGNASAPDVSSGPNTFDANFVGVYHGGDGATLSVADSSPAANHGTNSGATAAAGIAGGAMEFGGDGDYISGGTIPNLYGSLTGTVSCWFKRPVESYAGGTVRQACGTVSGDGLYLQISQFSSNWNLGCVKRSGVAYAATVTLPDVWYHAVGTCDATNIVAYLNGVAGTPLMSVDRPILNAGLRIGGTALSSPFLGLLDEIRISNVARSAAWIAAEYGTIAAPASWQTWGAEESVATAKPWLYRRSSRIIGGGVL